MNISERFIRRPIATSLLGIALLIGGGLGYWALPVSALPQVDFPTVQVTTQLPGASPDVIASLITATLERQLGQIPSLSSMQSTSSFGVSQISLQFDLNRSIDGAAQDVQTAINAAGGLLPKDLPNPPTYKKTNPADRAILIYAVHSDSMPIYKVDDFAYTILAQQIQSAPGVGQVAIAATAAAGLAGADQGDQHQDEPGHEQREQRRRDRDLGADLVVDDDPHGERLEQVEGRHRVLAEHQRHRQHGRRQQRRRQVRQDDPPQRGGPAGAERA